jgi:integrase
MACVRRRRDRWVADYRSPDGKRHWETFATRKEAEAALAAATVAIRSNRYVPSNDKRTVADAHTSWRTLCVEGSDNKSGKPLRATTAAFYSTVWRVHLAPRWAALKLRQVDAESVARWKQEQLDKGVGARTMLCALQVLAAVFKHARRFGWTAANPMENVHRPRHIYEVKPFTPAQIAAMLEVADPETALIIRTLASTGLRFGELAGLRWSTLDLERGVLQVREQFTHGAWSELKTANARRTIPLPYALRDLLRARYASLNSGSIVLHPRSDDRLVFASPEGGELEYSNWRLRRWNKMMEATRPDAEHPKRVAVTGTPHMLRHSYATALIQAGENAKTVQTLMGHHSVAFTMDQYAQAWPEAISNAGEKAASLLFAATGSKTVAALDKESEQITQVVDLLAPPAGVEPTTYRLGDNTGKNKPPGGKT